MATKKAARPLRPPRKPRKAARDLVAAKRAKLHVKSGDLVQVLSGKSAGHEGRVLRVFKKKSRATVEGANIMKKHQKPNAQYHKGQVIETEAPIHVSNLKVIEPA